MFTLVHTLSSVKAKTGEIYLKPNGQLDYVGRKYRGQHNRIDIHIISDEKAKPKGWAYDTIRKCTTLYVTPLFGAYKIVRSTDRTICPYDVRPDIIFHYIYHFNRNEVFDFESYYKSLFTIDKPNNKPNETPILNPIRSIACDGNAIFVCTSRRTR